MTIVELTEWERRGGLNLTADVVHAFRQLNCVDIRPDRLMAGRWEVQAQHWVGALRAGSVELRINPKVPVHRLFALLGEVPSLPTWNDDEVLWGDNHRLLEHMARVLCVYAERVARSGLLQGYRSVEESLPTVRGRVLVGAQLSRRAGLPLPLEVAYDDYTVDILENQLIAGAVDLMMRFELPGDLQRRLRRLRHLFEGVASARAAPHVTAVRFTRLNERYRSAIGIARLILSSSSLEANYVRPHRGVGLLLDMNRVYETVIGQRLRQHLSRLGGEVHLQRGDSLDVDGRLEFRPDVAWSDGASERAVLDLKYKRADKDVAQADVYQAVTYAIRFGLNRAYLVYPSPPPYRHLQIGAVRVLLHHVPLDGAPEELDATVNELALRIATESVER